MSISNSTTGTSHNGKSSSSGGVGGNVTQKLTSSANGLSNFNYPGKGSQLKLRERKINIVENSIIKSNLHSQNNTNSSIQKDLNEEDSS
jgi:hypothetical protein